MEKKIPTQQVTFSAAAFILASSLLTREVYMFLGQESWIAVLFGSLAGILVIQIYQALSKRFEGMGLVELNDAVFGKILGKVVTSLYFLYFLILCFLNTRDLSDFVKGSVLPKTPTAITTILFLLLCSWALRKGMRALTSCGFIFAFFCILAILINGFLLLKDAIWRHFLPLFTKPILSYVKGTHLLTMLPLCEIFAFYTILPNMQKPDQFGRALKKGLLMGGATLMFLVLRDIAVMGEYVTVSSIPSFAIVRLINVGNALTRVEIVYAIVLISLLFFKTSVLYYATVSTFSKMMGFESYQFLVLVFGALIVVYSGAVFPDLFDHVIWQRTVAATFSTFFLLVLPAVTLLTAVVRKKLAQMKEKKGTWK